MEKNINISFITSIFPSLRWQSRELSSVKDDFCEEDSKRREKIAKVTLALDC
jgi:hypothetical protein